VGADRIEGEGNVTTTEPPAEHLACGSAGEHALQHRHGTTSRASAFYRNQVIDHLNGAMCSFIARQEMVFVATADGRGHADCSFRAGPPGFVRVLDERTLAYPEYRGNGVLASLGNLTENDHVGMLFVDFTVGKIGLHVNGSARIVENDELARSPRAVGVLLDDLSETGGRRPERWVIVSVDEAYIHCSKHIPRMRPVAGEVAWGTDDERAKGGDYFGVRASRVSGSRP
jgi:predicted pyridoxine 5'-phosphate oxidase superfamily flavin-nucleotide-binding protein